MSTITTITKERIANLIEFNSEGRDYQANAEQWEVHELARIALASLEAEPVAYSLIFRNMDGVLNDYVNANTTFSTIEKAQAYGRGGNYVRHSDGSLKWVSDPSLDPVVVPLYTAPPAPVSLTDEQRAMLREMDDEIVAELDEEERACRAAMLQGAESVSNHDELPLDYLQGNKDGLEWAAQLAEANHPQTGDWLYDDPIELAKAIRKGPDMPESAGNSPVIPDGWVMVPVEPTHEMLEAGDEQFGTYDVYRRMIAAAPQQEVK